ncbi:3'(2'),5'-bisphosphate nucleotidase CysQ [Rhizorhabdus dicambivorans]|uniref:3'(2'),5'-bisphosphate nucleotidase CysQ n=1 Tax=Rhizorhabdus dicambivorans TaxID=1850238 RepID=A0A2A4FP42_9SPHN|nr:3'(2'),5'-bisphosphate nucleotidase CysQ [Rhizorhabdus dicambivorans]ATE63973.1 3'(2'),5'-bisphosphate nucleotidase CysQ [Rhizorhabdus dicambivorans]PCE40173.1 3'(2'),5'-bisphosphate nucleotidase CysQ [Rhizorhabdus dicambivorans]
MTDAELAAHLAETAGRILTEVRASGLFGTKALGKAGDQTANQFLCHAIREQRPEDGLLSEESKDTEERLGKSRVWIIDPVDGTREYGEARADWAVHVALTIDGVPAIGAVALPGLDGGVVLRTDRPAPVPPAPDRLRMLVSRTRPAAEAVDVADRLGAELVPMGSAGAKAMAVVRGEADIYLHSGGQYEWDSCAPAAVALAHGLHASRIDGSPLHYNQRDVYMPDLLICRQEHAARVLGLIGTAKAAA